MPETRLSPVRRRKYKDYHRVAIDDELWVLLNATPDKDRFTSFALEFPPSLGGRQAAVNQYIGTYSIHSSGSSITPVQYRVYYIPVQIPYMLRLVEFSVDITTREDDKQARLGIYSFERGEIRRYIFSNVLALNTTGVRITPVNISLSPGTYMFIYYGDSTTAAVKRAEINTPLLGYDRDDGNSQYTHYYEDKTTLDVDELGDFPAVTLATGDVPHIYAKVG